jgi:5'-AMP-activated protein kinase regulatory gamma subunit
MSLQLPEDIQQLHLPLRKLKIGTYVHGPPPSEAPEGCNPYAPIATATLTTRVFDVVQMFSGRSISAVPIIDEEGIVVNLYETVDVIVGIVLLSAFLLLKNHDHHIDTRPTRGLPIP